MGEIWSAGECLVVFRTHQRSIFLVPIIPTRTHAHTYFRWNICMYLYAVYLIKHASKNFIIVAWKSTHNNSIRRRSGSTNDHVSKNNTNVFEAVYRIVAIEIVYLVFRFRIVYDFIWIFVQTMSLSLRVCIWCIAVSYQI